MKCIDSIPETSHGYTAWETVAGVSSGLLFFCLINGATHLYLLCIITLYTCLIGFTVILRRHLSSVVYFSISLLFLFNLSLICLSYVSHGYSGNLDSNLSCDNHPLDVHRLRNGDRSLQESVELIVLYNQTSYNQIISDTQCEIPHLREVIIGQASFTVLGLIVLGIFLFYVYRNIPVPLLLHPSQFDSGWNQIEFEGRSRFSFWQLFTGVLGGLGTSCIVHLALLDYLIGLPLLCLVIVGAGCLVLTKRGSTIICNSKTNISYEDYHELFGCSDNDINVHHDKRNRTLVTQDGQDRIRKISSSVLVITSIVSLVIVSMRLSSVSSTYSVQNTTGLGYGSPIANEIKHQQQQSTTPLATSLFVLPNLRGRHSETESEGNGIMNSSVQRESNNSRRLLPFLDVGERLRGSKLREQVTDDNCQKSKLKELQEETNLRSSLTAGLMSIVSEIMIILMLILSFIIFIAEVFQLYWCTVIVRDVVMYTKVNRDNKMPLIQTILLGE